MDIYSSWRHSDVADLIPELNGALADPSHIDAEILQAKLDKVLGKQVSDIQAIIAGDDFQQIGHTEDPHALARVLRKLETSMLDIKRVMTFSHLAPLHYADQQAELEAPLNAMAQQLQGVAGFLNQSFSQVISCVAQLDDAQLREMMASSEELKEFAPLIEKCRKAPKPNPEIAAQPDVNGFTRSLEQFHASGSIKLSDDERKQKLAKGLTGVIRFKQQQAKAAGFKDTMAQFAFANEAPQDLIDNLATASQKHMDTLVSDFMEIQKLAKDKLPRGKQKHQYTWEETKDIVCAAYTKLDPELGKLARRAFDEGWVLAKEYGVPNPHTLAGLPVS